MGKFERDLMIQDTLEDLMTTIENKDLVINYDPTNLTSAQAIQAYADRIKDTYFLTDEEGKVVRDGGIAQLKPKFQNIISQVDAMVLDKTSKRLGAIAASYDSTYVPLSRNGDKYVSVTENTVERPANAPPKNAVSYTHLTLPTNREV